MFICLSSVVFEIDFGGFRIYLDLSFVNVVDFSVW